MGVRFFDCAACGGSVCDAGPYFSCEKCGNGFHEKCVGPENMSPEDLDRDDYETEEEYLEDYEACFAERCPICSLEIILDEDLVEFLLEKYKISRKDATKEYIAFKEEENKKKGSKK